jgi:oligoendopeptidase F
MSYPTTWNLARYFYTDLSDPRLDADIADILPRAKKFAEKYEHTFHTFTTPAEILGFYADYTEMSHAMATASYYLFYRSSLDTQDLTVTKKMGEVDYIYNDAANLLLFVAQGWKQIGYDRIMEWSRAPELARYKNDLVSTADNIKYILGEREEYVLNMKTRPLGLAGALHDELTGSYEFTMTIEGVMKTMTEEEVRSYRQHTDRAVREEAYKSLRRVYNSKQTQISMGNIYTSIIKDWSSEITMRGYGTNVMAQRNISEEMDDEVVDMLLSEVEKMYPVYQRFLVAKSRMLSLDTDFSVWDIGAPLGQSDKDFTFEEAYDLHLSVMQDFDTDFYDYSKRMIEEERIDVFPRAGKRG